MDANICLKLEGLNCANCAGKIEDTVKKLDCVEEVNLNLVRQEMRIKFISGTKDGIIRQVDDITQSIEPGVKVLEKSGQDVETVKTADRDGIFNRRFIRLALGAAIFALGLLSGFSGYTETAIFLFAYIILGYDVICTALRNMIKGNMFDENFLMSLSTIGAFAIGEYPEGVAVMLFYQVGEYFQDMAVEKSRKSIKELMNIKPEFANLITGDTAIKTVNPESVAIGDSILVKPGEKIPLDGVITRGKSRLDLSSLTGESAPVSAETGDEVLSGAVNMSGILRVKVTKDYSNSTVFKILELVENSSAKKAPTEKFITTFSRYYTPAVVAAAIALALVPPLLMPQADFRDWLYRALVFLVVSCPCALVISVPLSFMSGIGAASRRGVLIKGGNYLQSLSKIDTVVFDKTGTLTKGVFEVSGIFPAAGVPEDKLLKTALAAEKYSNHPIAKSITTACKDRGLSDSENPEASADFAEIPGKGLRSVYGGSEILVGNAGLMEDYGVVPQLSDASVTVVYVAEDKKYLGRIEISDTIKPDAQKAVQMLKSLGILKTVMLTGDSKETAERVASVLSIDTVYPGLLPDKKVEKLEDIYRQNPNSKVLFVGDGINDAPVLARADVGAAMGGIGSDAAVEAADVVIINDEPSKIAEAISLSRNTMKIVKQNIIFALAIKFIVLALGAAGLANMWMAVFADVGVALLVVLNSMRKK